MTLLDPTVFYILLIVNFLLILYGLYCILNKAHNSLSKVLWVFLVLFLPIMGSIIAILNFNFFDKKVIRS